MTESSAVSSVAAPTGRQRHPLAWGGLLFEALLLALIVAGLYFRFSWVNWNQGTDLHPDEYGLTSTITRLALPESLGDYFNTRLSPISPYQKYDESGAPTEPGPDNRMRWGQWPITLIRAAAEATGDTGYGELRLLGRRMSAVADSLSLLVLFLIGLHLYGRRAGLLAAALAALAVMPIQQAHFMTADNFAVLFTLLCMYGAVRVARGGGWHWHVFFGVFFGMAVASRINLVPLFAEIGVAAFIAHYPRLKTGDLLDLLSDISPRLFLAGMVALLTFRVTQPMTFRAETGDTSVFTLTPNPDWLESMKVAQAESSGIGGGPPGEQWTNRPALVFPWLNMVLWGMGLPLGLAAWAGFAWAAWRALKDDQSWKAHLLPLTWAGGYFLFMGTRWVKSIRYFLPIYPFLILLAAWALLELWRRASSSDDGRQTTGDRLQVAVRGLWSVVRRPAAAVLIGLVMLGTLAWAWGFTSIYRTDNTRIQASRWIYQNVPAPVNLHLLTGEGSLAEPLPIPDGLPISAEVPYQLAFRSTVTGTLSGLTLGHARAADGPGFPARLQVVLSTDPAGTDVLAQVEVPIDASTADPRGGPVSMPFGPAALEQGRLYYLNLLTLEGQAVLLSGAAISNEHWDEGLPLRIDGRDAFGGLYRGLEMQVRWQDNQDKLQMFLRNLAEVDFVILPSQRGLWSASRLPNTYPLTLEYYRALFDGRLGFELAAEFQSPIRIGPLQVSDVAGTWAWGRLPDLTPNPGDPFNDNPLSAEEAFSVYDHAPVWIFRKRPDFNLAQAQAVLNAVDLSTVVNQGPRDATAAPNLMQLPSDLLAAQRAGGTWREMFSPESLINRSQPVGVLVWWLAVVLLGWIAFPLTALVFGGVSDRGYPLAKSVALLVVAWLAWIAGSLRVLPFTRGTLVLGVLLLAAVALGIYWTRRAEFHAFVRTHWRHLLAVEALFLALFVFGLLIRLGNPDLWHPWKGGEKPMDFSYFNAVLKSTYFPPYDPWLAGGYINYYYYGYVLAAVPVKLLGVVPAFAYNLLIPTLLALLGVNAFSVAYNLVAAGLRPAEAGPAVADSGQQDQAGQAAAASGPAPSAELQTPAAGPRPLAPSSRASLPNPLLAGVAAALLAAVLGNLGQVEFLARSFQRAADPLVQAESPAGVALLNGLWRVGTGQAALPASLDAWYWDASRVVANRIGDGNGNEITEFPIFTFLYADLHAHMIAFPFAMLALAWAAAAVLGAVRSPRAPGAGGQPRSRAASLAFWIVGGLIFGAARPTNTWDYPVYLAIGLVAVAAGRLLADGHITRANLFGVAWRALLLVGLATVFYSPYDRWFASGYTEVELWAGQKTPLDAYLYVHGLFLFVLATFLVRETRRWLADTPASVLARRDEWLPGVLIGLVAFAFALAALLIQKINAALVSLPLMVWAGLLILRGRASMPPEKRVVLFLLGTGLAITLVVEMVVLKGDIGRQNTIFKFYLQVWLMFSVAAGAGLAWVWAELQRWRPAWRGAWSVLLAALVTAAALYTTTAAAAKIRDRFPSFTAAPDSGCQSLPGIPMPYPDSRGLPLDDQPHTLDGLAYLTWSGYCDRTYFLPLVYDYDAMRWLQDNVQGSPVLAEAQSFDLYRMSSRYAWNTGLPNVVGWDWHQRQQRAAAPTEYISQRGFDVIEFYDNSDLGIAGRFIEKYDVRYIIVGPMERAYYLPEGLAKFERLVQEGDLSIAYQNPGVTIYEVTARATQ